MNKKQGFTLVELSIVLVILGLLVGGVLTGQSLIHAAELRSVSTSLQSYQTAVYAFRDKYFALPGDMTNAPAFWPTATAGLGAGEFGHFSNRGVRAWQHLTLAGLIPGTYPGTQAAGADGACSKTECPKAKMDGLVFLTVTSTLNTGPLPYNLVRPNGIFIYDGVHIDYGQGMKPEDAYNLDMKIDDGKPGTGSFIGMGRATFYAYAASTYNGWASCATAADGLNYDLPRTDKYCRPYFLMK